jgi:hypothetical protein
VCPGETLAVYLISHNPPSDINWKRKLLNVPVNKDLLLEFLEDLKAKDDARYEREHRRYLDEYALWEKLVLRALENAYQQAIEGNVPATDLGQIRIPVAGFEPFPPRDPNLNLNHLIARLQMCDEPTVEFSCEDAQYYRLPDYLLPKVNSGV